MQHAQEIYQTLAFDCGDGPGNRHFDGLLEEEGNDGDDRRGYDGIDDAEGDDGSADHYD